MHAQERPPELTLRGRIELPAPAPPNGENLARLNEEVFSFLQQTLDAGILSQIYREFLERTRGRICELSSINQAEVREFAHTVAGTAGMLGATALAAFAGTAGAMEPDSGELKQLARTMEAECEHLETELRRRRVAL